MINKRSSQKIIAKIPSILLAPRYSLTQIDQQITFTPAFYEIIQQKLQNKPENEFLRLQIFAGQGCEGFTYKFKFDSQLDKENDYVKTCLQLSNKNDQQQKVLFAVNGEDLKFLNGATIDYAQQMMRQVFFVKQNPNADIQCSCKTSFSPKDSLL